MAKVTVYVKKDSPWEYIIFPAPSKEELHNYHVLEAEEDELFKLPRHFVYDPAQGKFVPCAETLNRITGKRRKEAYEQEADPLYKEWQYELMIGSEKAEEAKAKWLDKVQEIKERFPKQGGTE